MSPLPRAQGPTQIYPDGNFTYPDRFPLSFYEGSEIVITWTTVYKRSNLFVAQYENDGDSVPIANNIQETFRSWVVKTAYTNLTLPFHFRIVNSEGSNADQATGGFWSPGFYILRATTSSTTSASPTASQSSQISSSSTTSQSSQTPISLTTSPSSQTSVSLTTSPSSQTSTAVPPPASSISSGAIAGIAIGAVVFFSVFGALLFYLGKRSRHPVQRRTGEVGQEHVMYTDSIDPETRRGKVWGRQEAIMLGGRQVPVELS